MYNTLQNDTDLISCGWVCTLSLRHIYIDKFLLTWCGIIVPDFCKQSILYIKMQVHSSKTVQAASVQRWTVTRSLLNTEVWPYPCYTKKTIQIRNCRICRPLSLKIGAFFRSYWWGNEKIDGNAKGEKTTTTHQKKEISVREAHVNSPCPCWSKNTLKIYNDHLKGYNTCDLLGQKLCKKSRQSTLYFKTFCCSRQK